MLKFIFIVSFFVLQNECYFFKEDSIEKIEELDKKVKFLTKSNSLKKNDLIKIILPEYITFSEFKNDVELAFILINYKIGDQKFKEISFGPFQMQLKFIDKYLKLNKNIGDDFFIEYNDKNYEFLIDNIEKLNTIEFQWEILKTFADYEYKLQKNKSDQSTRLSNIIKIYNSGTTSSIINNREFTKIECKNMSYEEWCYEIYYWYFN